MGLARVRGHAGPSVFARYAPAPGFSPHLSQFAEILLLDEPFTSLDDRAIAMLSELLIEARQRGATIMLSTHQLREALAIASHVALVENGRLRYTGERTPEMLEDPGLLYRLHTELGAA